MAVTFVGAGALAGNATAASQAISCHADTAIGDILICQLINKSVTANAFSPPDGTWTAVIATEVNDCTTAADDHQFGLYWKRATVAGAQSFTFTKAIDDNVLFAGVISSWRGALSSGSPLDATAAVRTKTAGAADNVSFPAYDPTSTSVHVIYMAYYGNDLTTFAAAMSADTNPDCTTRYDLETGTGNDCSLACTSGDNDGSSIAARTWASASTADAGNTGVVFALVAQADAQGLTPSLFSDTDAFPAATASPGAVALTANLFTDTDALFVPTVARPPQALTVARFDDADVFPPLATTDGFRITEGGNERITEDGNYRINEEYVVFAIPRLDETESFPAPTVAPGAVNLAAALFADADVFPAAAAAPGSVSLVAALFSDAESFPAPTVSASADLTAGLFTDSDTFPAPTVATGAIDLVAARFDDVDAFPAPTAAPGPVALIGSLFTDDETSFQPIVSAEGGPQQLVAPLFSDTDAFPAAVVSPGAVSIVSTRFDDADSFFAPLVAAGSVQLAAARFDDQEAFFAPTVAPLGVDVEVTPTPITARDFFFRAAIAVSKRREAETRAGANGVARPRVKVDEARPRSARMAASPRLRQNTARPR